MRRQLLALALLAHSAAGCASLRGGPEMPGSFVAEGIAPADAPAISSTVASFVTMRAPPGPIALDAPEGDPADLAEKVAADLRAAGHAVSPSGRNRLSYRVEEHARGTYLVRIALDGERAARILARGQGGRLEPASPYTVTLAEAK